MRQFSRPLLFPMIPTDPNKAAALLESARTTILSLDQRCTTWLLVSVACLFPLFWLTSFIIPGLEKRAIRALQLLVFWTLGIALTVAGVYGAVLYADQNQSGGLFFASAVVGSLAFLAVIFLSPLATHRCTIGQSIAIVSICCSVFTAGQWAAASRFGWPFNFRPRQDIKKKLKAVRSSAIPAATQRSVSDEALMADRTKPLPVRKEAAARFAKKLEDHRRNHSGGTDSPELLRAEKRYKDLMRVLQSDAQAASTP
jgi:hypothetical protein